MLGEVPHFIRADIHKTKSHARSRAWLTSPVRHRTLAPFGGITRIRFKGSPLPLSRDQTLSHCGSPALCFFVKIGLAIAKSMVATCCSVKCIVCERQCRRRTAIATRWLWLDWRRGYPAGFVAGSSFMFVWKIASQSCPSFFHTDPALYVPEASLPSRVPSTFTV